MTHWLFWGVPIITSAYAMYEVRRSPKRRRLGFLVAATGVYFAFLFGFDPVTISTHARSSTGSVERVVEFWPAGHVFRLLVGGGGLVGMILVRVTAFVVHFTLLTVLMACAAPDVPELDGKYMASLERFWLSDKNASCPQSATEREISS